MKHHCLAWAAARSIHLQAAAVAGSWGCCTRQQLRSASHLGGGVLAGRQLGPRARARLQERRRLEEAVQTRRRKLLRPRRQPPADVLCRHASGRWVDDGGRAAGVLGCLSRCRRWPSKSTNSVMAGMAPSCRCPIGRHRPRTPVFSHRGAPAPMRSAQKMRPPRKAGKPMPITIATSRSAGLSTMPASGRRGKQWGQLDGTSLMAQHRWPAGGQCGFPSAIGASAVHSD